MADSRGRAIDSTPPRSPGDAAREQPVDGAGTEASGLEEAFRRFAVHGDTRASGREMHGKNWTKLCRDCGVIDGRSVTVTDVDIVFSKIKSSYRGHGCAREETRQNVCSCSRSKGSRTITFEQFQAALGELAPKRFKDKSAEDALREVYRLVEGKAPIVSGVTKAVSSPTVSRLTDTSRFTGSHKERFDPSGRGKGKAGRVDLVDESGYVSGYKHAGTYNQKVQGGK